MLNTKDFDYNKETKTLSQDSSIISTKNTLSGIRLHSRYLEVKSSHTNKVVKFHLVKTYKDASNEDVYYWEFHPSEKLENVEKLIIFND